MGITYLGPLPWGENAPLTGSTLKGSDPDSFTPVLPHTATGNATLSGSGNKRRAFRGRCPRLLSCALAGHETLRPYPVAPVGAAVGPPRLVLAN